MRATEWDSGIYSLVMIPMVWASLECWNDFPWKLICRFRVTHNTFGPSWQPQLKNTHCLMSNNKLISEYVCGRARLETTVAIHVECVMYYTLFLCFECAVSHRMLRGIWTVLQESKQYTWESTFSGSEEEKRGMLKVKMWTVAFAFNTMQMSDTFRENPEQVSGKP